MNKAIIYDYLTKTKWNEKSGIDFCSDCPCYSRNFEAFLELRQFLKNCSCEEKYLKLFNIKEDAEYTTRYITSCKQLKELAFKRIKKMKCKSQNIDTE